MGRPGFLENIFAQYDHIVSHSHAHPSPVAPDPTADKGPADLPPWWSPDEETQDGNDDDRNADSQQVSDQRPAPLPPEGPSRAEELGAGLLGAFSRIPKAPAPTNGFAAAAAADEAAAGARIGQYATPLLQRLSPEFAHAAEADRLAALARIRQYATPTLLAGEAAAGESALALGGLAPVAAGVAAGAAGVYALDTYGRYIQAKNKDFHSPIEPGEVSFSVDGGPPIDPYKPQEPPKPSTFETDEKGLQRAYADGATAYDQETGNLYVAGSHTARDWFDDLTKIPLYDTWRSERYGQTAKAYNDLLAAGKPVKTIVGHSLGGSVALDLGGRVGVPARTYGAPVLDLVPRSSRRSKPERYRHPLDPVSLFDRSAAYGPVKLNSHSYTGFV
jgi:hypothetical protein